MKTESLAPPLCLLGDDPASPFETVQITVGSASDDLAGNHCVYGARLESLHSGGRGQGTGDNPKKGEGRETRVLNVRTRKVSSQHVGGMLAWSTD